VAPPTILASEAFHPRSVSISIARDITIERKFTITKQAARYLGAVNEYGGSLHANSTSS
jgi:hypothetical protein